MTQSESDAVLKDDPSAADIAEQNELQAALDLNRLALTILKDQKTRHDHKTFLGRYGNWKLRTKKMFFVAPVVGAAVGAAVFITAIGGVYVNPVFALNIILASLASSVLGIIVTNAASAVVEKFSSVSRKSRNTECALRQSQAKLAHRNSELQQKCSNNIDNAYKIKMSQWLARMPHISSVDLPQLRADLMDIANHVSGDFLFARKSAKNSWFQESLAELCGAQFQDHVPLPQRQFIVDVVKTSLEISLRFSQQNYAGDGVNRLASVLMQNHAVASDDVFALLDIAVFKGRVSETSGLITASELIRKGWPEGLLKRLSFFYFSAANHCAPNLALQALDRAYRIEEDSGIKSDPTFSRENVIGKVPGLVRELRDAGGQAYDISEALYNWMPRAWQHHPHAAGDIIDILEPLVRPVIDAALRDKKVSDMSVGKRIIESRILSRA